jgi:hypothetical protein
MGVFLFRYMPRLNKKFPPAISAFSSRTNPMHKLNLANKPTSFTPQKFA